MRKYGRVYKAITVVAFLAIGIFFTVGPSGRTPDLTELVHEHPAVKMYYDGAWEGRYEAYWTMGGGSAMEEVIGITLSVNVQKDMTREEMVSILDYYELVANASFVGNTYVGEKDSDFVCFAVFFRGETDEELGRVKFYNGAEAEITEEDKGRFPPPYFHQEPGDEIKPWL